MRLASQTLLALTFLVATNALATPTCDVKKNEHKYYRLELTVPATFCDQVGSASDPSCKVFPKSSLIQLHGLWPNYDKGFPEGRCLPNECRKPKTGEGKFCGYPKPPGLYDSDVWKAKSGYMAGTEKCLERHEWVKHGTCSPMSNNPAAYFGWALSATEHIANVLEMSADTMITPAAFDAIVAEKLPELNGGVRLSCKGEYVSSIVVLYEWGEKPGTVIKTPAGSNDYDKCGEQFIFPRRP